MRHSRQIVLDVSTLLHWLGRPVGVVRVERALARWARRNLTGARYVCFDPRDLEYHDVAEPWIDMILAGNASIDWRGSAPAAPRWPRSLFVTTIARAGEWIQQPRRKLLWALERIRLRTDGSPLARTVEKLQRQFVSERYRGLLLNNDGTRRAYIPLQEALGAVSALGEKDVIVCAGLGFVHTDIRAIRHRKAQTGFRFVLVCYDIIPLQFPDVFPDDVGRMFRDYFEPASAIADCVIFNSRAVEHDVRAYCSERGIALRATAVAGLGADFQANAAAAAQLPDGLLGGRYVLFVSTIEPRKGHAMIYKIWRRLLDEGIPQPLGFKLVFVGRKGWMVDDLMRSLASDPQITGSLLIMTEVEDATLAALYRSAAFCVFPSIYEGYGIPAVEAFSFGKATIASTGGALPEIVGEFSPCLDPKDEDAWYLMLKRWILDPSARAPFEAAIRTRFRHPTWDEASARFFALLENLPLDR